jgi:hypothetical protein
MLPKATGKNHKSIWQLRCQSRIWTWTESTMLWLSMHHISRYSPTNYLQDILFLTILYSFENLSTDKIPSMRLLLYSMWIIIWETSQSCYNGFMGQITEQVIILLAGNKLNRDPLKFRGISNKAVWRRRSWFLLLFLSPMYYRKSLRDQWPIEIICTYRISNEAIETRSWSHVIVPLSHEF